MNDAKKLEGKRGWRTWWRFIFPRKWKRQQELLRRYNELPPEAKMRWHAFDSMVNGTGVVEVRREKKTTPSKEDS